MGKCVIIYGKSGVGKSRSLKGFAPDELYLVNVLGKPMPFKGGFKMVSETADVQTIMKGLAKMPCKVAVIDDAGYLMTKMFMDGHGGGDQFKLYNNIADVVWSLISFIQSPAVGADSVVYLMFHEETNEDGTNKIRTIGKLLDQKVCLEGMATVVLRATVKGDKHVFVTQNDGFSIAKSPEGMFTEVEIDNDLKAVDTAIRNYWGMKPSIEKAKKEAK